MAQISKLVLQEIPLFSELTDEDREQVSQKAEVLEYRKGQIIYEQGNAPSGFYCVLAGRVVISSKDTFGNAIILEYLHRAKYFGIISLLTNEPHSVTAQAINDCVILFIKKDDFDHFLRKMPHLAIDLSKTLSRRLKRKDLHQKTIFESSIISVFSSYSQAGKTIYALNLGLSLKKETHKSVVILDILPLDKIHTLPQKLGFSGCKILDLSNSAADNPNLVKEFLVEAKSGIGLVCFHYRPEDEICVRRLVGIISLLVNDYHFLIIDLPSLMDRPIFNILNQSDVIHILTSPEQVDLKRTRHLIERLVDEFAFKEEKIKVVINEYKHSRLTHEEQVEILNKNIFATLPKIELESCDRLVEDEPVCEYARAVRRIARQLGESMVGLVLGVGVGYGFCHIGVLKVIEEEKIPIDVIVGASIGSVIASLWAIGKSSEEILEITKEFKAPKHIWNLLDFTLPFMGFIKGNKLRKLLDRHLGNKTFYDVKLPLKIVASDVKRKESRVFEKGLLVDAIMASCAMPGVFLPFKIKEEMLFDGGIINPLPTEPLIKIGVKKIIAVNVTPSRQDILRQYEEIRGQISVGITGNIKKRSWFGLREYIRNSFKNNILDIIFSSIEVLQSEVALKEAQLADVVLHPNTSGLNWLELHRAEEFAKRGEEEARKNLDKIWQVIRE
ncbi:MAG: patatin-like phospholipase family protein [Candidatus Omnitrophica bacterium]|nr:patatin-like phospholipase family protein [Candidatus Omnitrophota bacterium]